MRRRLSSQPCGVPGGGRFLLSSALCVSLLSVRWGMGRRVLSVSCSTAVPPRARRDLARDCVEI